jgi:hypothetical protein
VVFPLKSLILSFNKISTARMKKVFLSFAMLVMASALFAHGDHQHDANPNITPYHDAAEVNLPSGYLLQQQAWKDFTQKYPSWGARFNRYTQLPHRAFGEPITYAPGGSDPVAKAIHFLQNELSGFNLPTHEMVVTRSANDGKYIHVDFKQVHNGMDVLWSRTTVRFTQDLRIVLVGTDLHRNIPTLNAALSPTQAIQKAEQAIVTSITGSSVAPQMKWFPLPAEGQFSYRPVYAVTVETQDDEITPGKYLTYVDAITGDVLYRQNKVLHIGFEAKADVYSSNLFGPMVSLPLRHLLFNVNGTNYNTDANGVGTVPGAGPINATLTLSGLYCKIVTGANGTTSPTFTANGINNNDVVTYTASSPNATERHLTAYYHTNVVHDYMKTKYPTFTTMDIPLTTRIDRTDGTCNAFYNGSSINFYTTAGGCNALSQVNTVVYHEYGHGISNDFWDTNGSSFDNGGMGEGYSDVWSMCITKDPIVGQGFYINQPNSFIRRYDINPKVYPQDLIGEVHADGEIIAGAWWDYAVNLSSSMPLSNAVDSMSDLYAASQYGLATGPDGTEGQVYYDILIDALQYDDDNNNINDGTPHFLPIVQAFAKHGILLLHTAELNHNPPGLIAASTNVSIDASAIVDYPAFLGDVKMFYRLKGATTVDSVIMTKTGTNFTGVFPGATQGQIYEYYFTIYDNTNFPSAFSPKESRFNITLSQRNIPHFLMVGFASMYHENFDAITTSTPGWIIGDAPSDNATGGKWIVANPIASMTNGDTVQTGKDHTTGTGKCAVTGNAASAANAAGSADVDAGRTSLVTQEFDITPYSQPVISYWRWFTNSQSTSNNRKDPWKAYSSYDNGVTWTLIERTYAPDVSWRRHVWAPNKANGNRVRLMFVVTDSAQGGSGNGGTWVEGALDDIEILDLGNPSATQDAYTLQSIIYPNPANQEVNMVLPESGELVYTLTNSLGAVLSQDKFTALQHVPLRIPVNDVANGFYFLKLTLNGKQSIHKVMISK